MTTRALRTASLACASLLWLGTAHAEVAPLPSVGGAMSAEQHWQLEDPYAMRWPVARVDESTVFGALRRCSAAATTVRLEN